MVKSARFFFFFFLKTLQRLAPSAIGPKLVGRRQRPFDIGKAPLSARQRWPGVHPPFAGVGEGRVTQQDVSVVIAWINGDGADIMSSNLLSDGAPPEMLFFERCIDWLAPGGRILKRILGLSLIHGHIAQQDDG